MVSVVVPAAVAVVVKPDSRALAVRFAFASRVASVEAVAAAETPEPVARPEMAGVVRAGEVMVCTPVNVLAASVLAMVALVDGKVMVVESVPSKVRVFRKLRVLPPVPVNVYVPVVKVFPLTVVAVAAPMFGVVRTGEVLKTRLVLVVPVVPVAALT
jgi:hypothetical protein